MRMHEISRRDFHEIEITPRSVEACREIGVAPIDLLPAPESDGLNFDFRQLETQGMDATLRVMRKQKDELRRRQWVRLAQIARKRIIVEENTILAPRRRPDYADPAAIFTREHKHKLAAQKQKELQRFAHQQLHVRED